MTTFNTDEVRRLAKAQEEINALRRFVIERIALYTSIHTGTPVELVSRDGYRIDVVMNEVFDEDRKTLRALQVDVQGGGNTKTFAAPRDFIFGDETQDERDWNKYLELKEKFLSRVK